MKLIGAMAVGATALALTACGATDVEAADFNVAGQTVSVGGKVDANYDTGTELYAMEFVPKAGINAWGVDFGVETTFDMLQLNDGDVFQGLDYTAGYTIGDTGLRAYGEISSDADFEFGDATVGVSFSF